MPQDPDMLDHDVMTGEAGAPVIIMMHGRGADRSDLAGLRPHLPPAWTLVLPDAPHDAAPWGYGPGRAWYRYLGGTSPEPDSFSTSLQRIAHFVDTMTGQGPVFLGGFSQGGTIALGHALSGGGGVMGVFNLSGFVPDHPAVDARAHARGLDVFWGHGLVDPNIPHDWAVAGRSQLREAGSFVEARDYRIGHWIAPEELQDFVAWVEATAAPEPGTV